MDVVRGIAILLVLSFHFRMPTGSAGLDAALQPIFAVGWAGVDLFFVLSGFLVGRILLDEAARPGGFRYRRFFVRRALRLWPALYLYLAVLWLIDGPTGWHTVWPVLLHVQNYVDWAPSHLWSLAVEEHFYLAGALALPAVLRFGTRWGVAMLAAIVLVCPALRLAALLAGAPTLEIQWQTQYRLDALALGVLLACCARHRPEWLERAGRCRAWLFAAAAAGWAWLAIGDAGALSQSLGFSIAAFSAAALLVAMLDMHIPRLLLPAARAVGGLGTIAYSLYLWHASLGRVAESLAPALGLTQPMLIVALKFALAIGLSWIAYVLVERPAMRLRDFDRHSSIGRARRIVAG